MSQQDHAANSLDMMSILAQDHDALLSVLHAVTLTAHSASPLLTASGDVVTPRAPRTGRDFTETTSRFSASSSCRAASAASPGSVHTFCHLPFNGRCLHSLPVGNYKPEHMHAQFVAGLRLS